MTASLLLVMAFASLSARAAEAIEATLYKNPGCLCCDEYAAYLRPHGFDVTVIARDDLSEVKREHAIPPRLQGCHTLLVDGYAVEGHVPVTAINKLLRERPDIRGISLPGMPAGSPGMGGRKQAPFVVYSIADDETSVFVAD